MIKRYLEKCVLDDLKEKMVFIGGPRQVGKTTFSKEIGERYFSDHFLYLNWDNRVDRQMILKGVYEADKNMLVFDEIHKYKNWKNYIKGEYDKYRDKFKIIVAGSSRMDIFRKGGDSLLGRYHYYRLHPFSLREIYGEVNKIIPMKELQFVRPDKDCKELFNSLLKFGGFPEVFLKHNDKTLRRWHNDRVDRLIREDIRDIENVRDLSGLQIAVELIPDKVGSLFSINSLCQDLGVTHKTVSLWVDILERFYYHFRIYSYQTKKIKSLRKEPKIYLWDWSELKDEGSKFENIVASHLLKFCHYLSDSEGYKINLNFIRDIEGREVDFVVTVDNKPWFCVEAKVSGRDKMTPLKYIASRLEMPFSYQVVRESGIDIIKDNIRIISADKFLTGLV